jgi:hypothetical protein
MSWWTKIVRPVARTALAAYTGGASEAFIRGAQALLPPPQTQPVQPYAGPGMGELPIQQQYGSSDDEEYNPEDDPDCYDEDGNYVC